jgi:Holliday junction resolvasome RuvABC endonuclease subunit
MNIIALDLSMSCSGVTVYSTTKNCPLLITSIKTKDKEPHGIRLRTILTEIELIKNHFDPKVVVIERAFSRFNLSTAAIYKVHGIVNCLFHEFEQIYYPPKSVKEAIKDGKATKKQVREAIEKAYPDIVFNNEDESDSYAVALTYLIKNNLIVWEKPIKKQVRKKKLSNE